MSRGRPSARVGLVVAALAALPASAQTDAETDAASELAAPEPAARTREVEPGDTLWSIATSAMGDGTLWPALYRANRDQIKDPTRIYPGQELAIPEVDPGSVASVRREAATLVAD